MSGLRDAIEEALAVSKSRRDKLRRAVDTGDPEVVFAAVLEVLGSGQDDVGTDSKSNCTPEG